MATQSRKQWFKRKRGSMGANLDLQIPEDAKVIGAIDESCGTDVLDQDMLLIELSNGIGIDLGWYPEEDPDGSFRVVVFKDFWDQRVGEPFETRSIQEAVSFINERLLSFQG